MTENSTKLKAYSSPRAGVLSYPQDVITTSTPTEQGPNKFDNTGGDQAWFE